MNNNKIDCAEIENMVKYYNDKDEHEKHLKGYMYDSLIYRYKSAREKLAYLEYKEYKQNKIENSRTLTYYKDLATRDLMRFIQILDEAVGEHD